jgi:hypothetical protein
MKMSILTAFGVAVIFLLAAFGANAQVSASGRISAEVIEALSAEESSSMNFGRFAPGEMGGTVIIPAKGAAISTSSVVSTNTNIAPAVFSVSGAKDATFSITLPDGPTTLTSASGSNTMLVDGWTATSEHGDDDYILAGGTQKVMVGATLKVGSADENPKGIYTGSFQVTFAYN